MSLTIGVPRETFAGEKRVATVPDVVEKLVKLGFGVHVETGAGAAANFDDASYEAAGARIAASAADGPNSARRVARALRYRLSASAKGPWSAR